MRHRHQFQTDGGLCSGSDHTFGTKARCPPLSPPHRRAAGPDPRPRSQEPPTLAPLLCPAPCEPARPARKEAEGSVEGTAAEAVLRAEARLRPPGQDLAGCPFARSSLRPQGTLTCICSGPQTLGTSELSPSLLSPWTRSSAPSLLSPWTERPSLGLRCLYCHSPSSLLLFLAASQVRQSLCTLWFGPRPFSVAAPGCLEPGDLGVGRRGGSGWGPDEGRLYSPDRSSVCLSVQETAHAPCEGRSPGH